MAGPGLQLFPPPPRPRQASPNSKQLRAKPPSPEPGQVERMDSAADFHELVVQVNSVPVSPENDSIPPPPPPPQVVAPPRAHLPVLTIQTPPQHQRPGPPPRPREASPNQQRSHPRQTPDRRAQSPPVSVQDGYNYRSQTSSPELNRTASPAFSMADTLVRANSTAQRNATPQPEAPMRSMFPVFDATKSLSQQAYKPTQASPTHIPRTQISRSPYSPDFYVPHNTVASSGPASPPPKPFFTPSHLLDNLWLAANGQEEPAVQLYTLRMHRATAANPTITFGTTPSLPFYSLAQSNLAGNNDVQSIMNELLIQRHHPTQPRVLPIAQLDLMTPPSINTNLIDPHQQEPVTLLTSIFPKLAALQALDAAANSPAASHIAIMDPGATSPAAQRLAEDVLAGAAQRECCALTWTRDPPQPQTNPWAQQMPSEGAYQLHHPTLGTFPIQIEGDCSAINRPSTRPITAIYGHNMSPMPQTPHQKPASITILNPYILSPSSPRANGPSPLPPPPRFDSLGPDARPISVTPSEMSVTQLPTTTDAAPDDAMLARLDFTNDAMVLNLGALTRFGNPFLVDVACSTLLSVAVAESVRGRRSRQNSTENFAPPPVPTLNPSTQEVSDAKAFKSAFRDGFNAVGGKVKVPKAPADTLRKWSTKSRSPSMDRSGSFDKDIELGDWYGQTKTKSKVTEKEAKKRAKKEKEEDKMPFVARTIITVLTFAFKAAVFVMKIAIKLVAGVVVMITRNFSRL
ncbi:hypothetical protein BU23DRAFT_553144 [Bimuria novae-zelandiae CBS 107.79]|uniref:Uncharacterized protein n=1 Tax=Bimuria novae-zelandiae CBS 107.79 TaxID=1447943 RepID=A0A6A5VCP1_9PLEO|nr:hypothetical protein BU23DRAFT_553144 [Bimuria novae-zelandiae CBS 107.79]